MNLTDLQKNWDGFGKDDPLWAVLTNPDKINNQWEEADFFENGQRHFQDVLSKLNFQDKIGGQRALDFGCGPGRMTQAICPHYKEVVGVDISKSMIEKAIELNRYGTACKYYVNTKDDLQQFEANSFDFIFSTITLQHIQPIYALNYIQEFCRLIKPKKYILFSVPYAPPALYGKIASTFGQKGINLARKIYFRKKWVMEMHWIEEQKVEASVVAQGCKVIKKVPEHGPGATWRSNFYLVTK